MQSSSGNRVVFLGSWICFLAMSICLLIPGNTARAHGPADDMLEAANAFLSALDDSQRDKATFPLNDEERSNWHFIPRSRNGLPLKEMTASQQQLAYTLLQSALSHQGFKKSLQIMTLEQILHEMENGSPRRDPELYFVSIFGKPSTKATWGWRVEGHHLSLNFTLVDGHQIVSTPSFFGTNPADVKQGPRKGLRVLAVEEDLGRQLVKSLTPEQRKTAIVATEAPRDIINVPGRNAETTKPLGLAVTEMDEKQREILKQLVREYVFRLRPDIAENDLKQIREAGFSKIHFAWAGGLERGEGHYYRVQGPTFILEYDNTQNDANHVHCAWRDFKNDFGEDLLGKHYKQVAH